MVGDNPWNGMKEIKLLVGLEPGLSARRCGRGKRGSDGPRLRRSGASGRES